MLLTETESVTGVEHDLSFDNNFRRNNKNGTVLLHHRPSKLGNSRVWVSLKTSMHFETHFRKPIMRLQWSIREKIITCEYGITSTYIERNNRTACRIKMESNLKSCVLESLFEN